MMALPLATLSHCRSSVCHEFPIKSTLQQTPHHHTNNMDRSLVISVFVLNSGCFSPSHMFDMAAIGISCTCMFWQQNTSNQNVRERTTEPTASCILRRLRWLAHLLFTQFFLIVRSVYHLNPNIHGWKTPRGRPKTRRVDSVKHDLHSAGLNTIATQCFFDRSLTKSFVNVGLLPTLESSKSSTFVVD